MKKTVIFLCVLSILGICSAVSLTAQNFGLVLDNASDLSQDANPENNIFTFLQKDKLALWLEAYLGGQLKFFLQGSYTFATDQYLLFDVDSLYLQDEVPFQKAGTGLYIWQAGRFMVNEFSRHVFAHRLDGLALELKFPAVNIRLASGFTGLLLNESSEIILSQADLANANKSEVFFGSPRLVGLLQFDFPELLQRLDFSLALLIQQDLWDSGNLAVEGETLKIPGQGGKLHTQYLGLGLSGPLVVPFYFDTFFYLGTGAMLSYVFDEGSGISSYENKFLLSGLGGLSLKLYLEEQLYQTVSLDVLFATGDSDYRDDFYEGNTADLAHTFIPVSKQKLGLVFSPVLGNLALVELSYSLKPFSRAGNNALASLQVLTKGLVFFRTSQGLISESGLNPDSDSAYLGTEADLIINYRPLSDLGVALSWGFFFPYNSPGTGTFLPEGKAFKLRGLLEISMAF